MRGDSSESFEGYGHHYDVLDPEGSALVHRLWADQQYLASLTDPFYFNECGRRLWLLQEIVHYQQSPDKEKTRGNLGAFQKFCLSLHELKTY